MRNSPVRESFDDKKIRAKGKWFVDCYFERCNIVTNDHTIFFNCIFFNCHSTGRGSIDGNSTASRC